jgi:CRP/FNR family transcriptional regulator
MFTEAPMLVQSTSWWGTSLTVKFGDSQRCSPFQLSTELLEALAPLSSSVRSVPGDRIVEQGARCHGIYVIHSGLARVSILAPGGREVFKRLLGPGCVIGLPASLCSEPYNFSASCQSDCALGFIEVSAFQEFLRTQPLLCMEVVRLMGQELTEMNQRRTNFKQCRQCGCSFADICSHEMGTC